MLTTVAAALLALLSFVDTSSSSSGVLGFQVKVTNKCNDEFDLYHNGFGSEESAMIAPGMSKTYDFPAVTPSHVFKKNRGGQATCAYTCEYESEVWQ